MHPDQGIRRRRDERRLAGEHLEEHARERVDVGPLIDDAAGRLFGTHVLRRADHHADHRRDLRAVLFRRRRAQRSRDAEVGDQRHAVEQQDVLGLDVAVDEILLVRVRERSGDLTGQPQRLFAAAAAARAGAGRAAIRP